MKCVHNKLKLEQVISTLHEIAQEENASALEGLAIDLEVEYMNLLTHDLL